MFYIMDLCEPDIISNYERFIIIAKFDEISRATFMQRTSERK